MTSTDNTAGSPKPGLTRHEGAPAAAGATRYEAVPAGPGATRHEPVPGGTRHESGGGAPGATRHEPGHAPEAAPRRRFNLPTKILDRFHYERDLAYGAQADVVLCRNKQTGQPVAIKLYRASSPAIDLDALDRLRSTEPDHVVPLLELDSAEGQTWEAQEYFELGSLSDLVTRHGGGALDVDLVRAIVEELTAAIVHIHEREIVHRDLKPQNILVRSESPIDCVLADFGLARELVLSADLGSVAGTFAYIAPEGTHGRLSKASDWWALGVLVHEILTGRHMFASADGQGLLPDGAIHAALAERSYSFAGAPDERWERLLAGLLTHDRNHRWGGEQVNAWLRGDSPEVYAEAPTTAARGLRGERLHFAGGSYTDPEALAAAFRERWSQAADYLVGQGIGDLVTWLHQTEVGDAADEVLEAVRRGYHSPERALVELQMLLDPSTTPVFRSRSLDSAGFNDAIQAAGAGTAEARSWIKELRTAAVFAAAAKHATDGAALAQLGEDLRIVWRRIDELLEPLQSDGELRPLLDPAKAEMEPKVFAAVLSANARKDLHGAARRQAKQSEDLPTPLAALAGNLASRNPGSAASADDAVCATLIPLVREHRRVVAEDQRRAEQARQQAVQEEAKQRSRAAAAARRRQARADLFRHARKLLLVGAIWTAAWTFAAVETVGPPWPDWALDFGIPAAIAIAIVLPVDTLVPSRKASGLSLAGAGLALWYALVHTIAWSEFEFRFVPGEFVDLPLLTAAGYAAGSIVGHALDQVPGRRETPTGLPDWVRFLPLCAVLVALVSDGARALDINLMDLIDGSPDFVTDVLDATYVEVPGLNPNTGPGLWLTMGVALLAFLALAASRDIEHRSRNFQRLLWTLLNAAAALVVVIGSGYLVVAGAANA